MMRSYAGKSRNKTGNKIDSGESLQRKATNQPASMQCRFSGDAGRQTAAPGGGQRQNATGMPDTLKSGLERLSGFDMSPVRVHYNSPKPARVGALAYAQGTSIHLGPGQERHLPHESWHVVQQMQGRVRPTRQYKGVDVNDDRGLEREADVMGANAANGGAAQFAGGAPSAYESPTNGFDSPHDSPMSLKTASVGPSDKAPLQGRFGFEIEVPILFLHKRNFGGVPTRAPGGLPPPTANRNAVPCDAAKRNGEVNVYSPPGVECHVNVDHNGALNPLYRKELLEYANANGLNANETEGLLYYTSRLMPHGASILEVVTDSWDESTLSRLDAQQRFTTIRDWVSGLFNQIGGNTQAALGNYFIGSTASNSGLFQPRLGYFHATYGIKLSQIPTFFQHSTAQKDNLQRYARTHQTEREHADNLFKTYRSVARAQEALDAIKDVWPRNNSGWFTNGYLHTKGTKGWNAGTEEAFLGFLTLVNNYLLMFQANRPGNLSKQRVGMHYYKSDLYDVAQRLPNEIITNLRNDGALRNRVIMAIAESVELAYNTQLTGPMRGWTVLQYLNQLFRGNSGVRGRDVNNAPIYDPLLAGSINPYSSKLGPQPVGPALNQEMGVVLENRHLEYLDPNYGRNQTGADQQIALDSRFRPQNIPDTRTQRQKDVFDSIKARESGAARRPINEWVNMMLRVYDMLVGINQ